MTTATFSIRSLSLIAQNTLREAVRQRVFGFLLLLALGLVLGVHFFQEFNFGTPELRFIADLGFGAIGLLGAVLAVTATAQLFFSELENRTVLTLLAKPLGHAEFVLGKFLGAAAVTGDPSTGVEGIAGRESTRHGGEVMTRDAVDDR